MRCIEEGGRWMEGLVGFCHVPAHTQQLTGKERDVPSGLMNTRLSMHPHFVMFSLDKVSN